MSSLQTPGLGTIHYEKEDANHGMAAWVREKKASEKLTKRRKRDAEERLHLHLW